MSLNAGSLNRQVSVQSRASGQDAAGQPNGAWAESFSCWANYRAPTGLGSLSAERVSGGAELSTAACSWRIRFRTGVTAGMRVVATDAVRGATATITIASPGVVTWTAHGMSNGDEVKFVTTGALPTGLAAGTVYYVVNKAADTFQVAATRGGAAINTSGTQSGVHTAYYVTVTTWDIKQVLPDYAGREYVDLVCQTTEGT